MMSNYTNNIIITIAIKCNEKCLTVFQFLYHLSSNCIKEQVWKLLKMIYSNNIISVINLKLPNLTKLIQVINYSFLYAQFT